VSVFIDSTQLAIVGDVTPNEVTTACIPGASLGPKGTSPEPLHRGVSDFIFGEARVQYGDAAIGIMDGTIVVQIRFLGSGDA